MHQVGKRESDWPKNWETSAEKNPHRKNGHSFTPTEPFAEI